MPTVDDATGYVTIAQVRALPGMSNPALYDDAEIEEARQWFETTFEDYVGVAYVPRAATATVDGPPPGFGLVLPHMFVRSITSLSVYHGTTLTPFTTAELADLDIAPTGFVYRRSLGSWVCGRRNYVVEYDHGRDSPPAHVVRAALTGIQERLRDNHRGTPADRQFSVQTEAGIVRNALPGPDRPFGIPEVDAVAERERAKYYPVAMA